MLAHIKCPALKGYDQRWGYSLRLTLHSPLKALQLVEVSTAPILSNIKMRGEKSFFTFCSVNNVKCTVSLPVWGDIGNDSPSNVSLLAHFSSFSPLLILHLLQCVPLELAVFFSSQSNISGKVDRSVFPPLFISWQKLPATA